MANAGDGENPWAGLVQARNGNFYGTTYGGGTNGAAGTVFKITPNGALTSLYSFTGGNDRILKLSDGHIFKPDEATARRWFRDNEPHPELWPKP